MWEEAGINHDRLLLWAAATVCFFGFFRSGEITVPSVVAFDSSIHLSWGDVAVDNPANPSSVHFYLKRSKCDQFGAGVGVFVGKTGTPLCPVTAVLAYLVSRGSVPGPFPVGSLLPSQFSFGRYAMHSPNWAYLLINSLAIASVLALPQRQPRQDWRTR